MVGRAKVASSVASTLTNLLRRIWSEWDVRGMVLLSLLLQIALYILGTRRRYNVGRVGRICRMILWFAYTSADWVAIAALGKLSNARALSPPKNVLRALWAPILILHLGGPDTITAYALQDTQLWTRHILTLLVQSMFAIYVIYLSIWTYHLLSILTVPLILAGIVKYVERILCLERTNSKKTEPVISMFHDLGFEMSKFIVRFIREYPESTKVLLGYLLFSVMRPDANDYFSGKLYLPSYKVRIINYLFGAADEFSHQKLILEALLRRKELRENPFHAAAAEMEFIFDIVYTKSSLTYTKTGCFLRLFSFTCSFLVLLLFLIRIMNEHKLHFSIVDIHITISLLVGTITMEFFAVYSMFCSHWMIPLMMFHENRFIRKILWNSKVYGFLEKVFSRHILENLHKLNHTRFVKVPPSLKLQEDYHKCLESFFKDGLSFEPTRGEKTLDKIKEKASFDDSQYKSLRESIELDFDISIIVWHLATSICYYQDVQHLYRSILIEDRKSSKYISDYMMYLLALQPAMLLPEHCRSFSLDDVCRKLKDLFSKASNMDHALTLLLSQDDPQARHRIPDPLNKLKRYTSNLVIALNLAQTWDRWEIIKKMWIEILLYAAHSCQHANHVKQLGQSDREFLTLIWVMGGSHFIESMAMQRY
ncbi:hypothetical protein SLEP1_g15831 [Rubroshorea leprosula]|uniref:DUF4220 domain-containing protein n=1 Tax=Rubroshorea leprosula TaxID=152421 RepID=A0AAV5J0E1_9ROSI|nr:hypothetical protein SLEP1_g15831 [Rubroshorea leprosula]